MAAACNIICDSTCDISKKLADELGLSVLPFYYIEAHKPDGGLSGQDDLFETISAADFYNQMRHGACPSTSQPSQAVYEQAFMEAHKSGIPTVMFSISSKLSGGYDGACLALERLRENNPEENFQIHIVDTKLASMALQLLVIDACKHRDEGMSAEELVAWAEEARNYLHTLLMVENLDALHRGGRIPRGVKLIGGALDVKPLIHIELDGSLGIAAVARGRKRAFRKMLDHFKKSSLKGEWSNIITLGDADAAESAYQLASELQHCDEDMTLLRPNIGPIVGSHVGPGAVCMSFWGEDRRLVKESSKVKGVQH